MHTRRLVLAGGLLAGALVGCGDDDAPAASGSSTTTVVTDAFCAAGEDFASVAEGGAPGSAAAIEEAMGLLDLMRQEAPNALATDLGTVIANLGVLVEPVRQFEGDAVGLAGVHEQYADEIEENAEIGDELDRILAEQCGIDRRDEPFPISEDDRAPADELPDEELPDGP